MWRQTLLYLGSWIMSCLIGYYCGYIVNVVYNVEGYDVIFGFFSLILGVIITLYFIKKADNKKDKYPNQIKVEPAKRLPFYKANKIIIFCVIPVFLLLFIFIGFYIYQYILLSDYFSIYMFWVVVISALTILLIVLMTVLTLLFEKGSLLNFEQEFLPNLI